MSSWTWQKRILYLRSLNAVNAYEQEQMPDVDSGDMPSNVGGSTPSIGSGASMPGPPSTQQAKQAPTTKDVPQSVANHEHVIKNQSDYD